jgi:hypothetical protein
MGLAGQIARCFFVVGGVEWMTNWPSDLREGSIIESKNGAHHARRRGPQLATERGKAQRGSRECAARLRTEADRKRKPERAQRLGCGLKMQGSIPSRASFPISHFSRKW